MKGATLPQLAGRIYGPSFPSVSPNFPLGLQLESRLVVGGNFQWLVFRGRYNRASSALLLRLNSTAVKRP